MRRLKRSECCILPLVLKRKWYEMIASGEKLEEYRDATPYWETRINNWANDGRCCVIEFRNGYARNAPRMVYEACLQWMWCESEHPDWGEPDDPHYVIALGERIILED